ncbi:hypothetical protein M3Y98_00856000 [Aphelenchoides besseyi]|nr:hypothetical protein M3Y98_00856000 [Aphelenchoides besseyi]KAI6211130.1 hypothetical protein M3Y96_00401000 [Aphelenchoides besseyi]
MSRAIDRVEYLRQRLDQIVEIDEQLSNGQTKADLKNETITVPSTNKVVNEIELRDNDRSDYLDFEALDRLNDAAAELPSPKPKNRVYLTRRSGQSRFLPPIYDHFSDYSRFPFSPLPLDETQYKVEFRAQPKWKLFGYEFDRPSAQSVFPFLSFFVLLLLLSLIYGLLELRMLDPGDVFQAGWSLGLLFVLFGLAESCSRNSDFKLVWWFLVLPLTLIFGTGVIVWSIWFEPNSSNSHAVNKEIPVLLFLLIMSFVHIVIGVLVDFAFMIW